MLQFQCVHYTRKQLLSRGFIQSNRGCDQQHFLEQHHTAQGSEGQSRWLNGAKPQNTPAVSAIFYTANVLAGLVVLPVAG